jgi:M6 family metalloprotease-like protein
MPVGPGRKSIMQRRRRIGGAAALALALAAIGPRTAGAVAVSPRVWEAVRGTPEEIAVRDRLARYTASRTAGVDRVYSQFALDLAKYPRGGVAHRNIMVVLCDFPAEGLNPGRHPAKQSTPAYYQRLYFSDDPNDGIISLREFYRINSHGRLVISGRVTPKWVTMPHSYAYYANGASGLDFAAYPHSAQRLAEDAMSAAFGVFDHDLRYFDNDGPDGVPHSGDDDGYIDAVAVIHPGPGAEIIASAGASDSLWSHEAGIAIYQNCPPSGSQGGCLPGMSLGDVRGFLYTMVGEYNEFPGDRANGTYCHEFGHTLGLPDLYDPAAAGLGVYSLMGLGNYLPLGSSEPIGSRPGSLDPWCRQFLGFEKPLVVTGPGAYTLPPLSQGGTSLKLWRDGRPGTEYFLVENRDQQGPDRDLPGSGVLIYHVDDTKIDNLSGPANYRVRVVQADGLSQLESPSSSCLGGYCGDAGDYFPGATTNRTFTEATVPNSRDYAGGVTGVRVTGIQGGAVDNADTASFNVSVAIAPSIHVAGYRIGDGGDGYADNGETDSLHVTVANAGTPSGSLSFSLSTADPGVTVTTGASSGAALGTGATEGTATPFVFDVGNYATLPHPVRFLLSWNDGSASGAESLTVSVGMGLGLSEDFEAGASGWTSGSIAGAGPNDWHASQSRAHGGLWSFKAGSALPFGSGTNEAQTYSDLEDAALYTPIFDLAPGSQLVFYSWMDAETNGGTTAWDGGRVEISASGGEWLPLAVDGGYGYFIEFNSSASIRGADAFSGSSQSWRRAVADLSAYSGPVQIRFRFASDEANAPISLDAFGSPFQSRYYEGWYVDDVQVTTRVAPGPTPRRLSLRAGPNPYQIGAPSAGAINIRFSAKDGFEHPGFRPKVRIFDLSGRLIRTLDAAPDGLIPSEFRATWDARNDQGRFAAAGIYFAHVDVLGHDESFRIVLLR